MEGISSRQGGHQVAQKLRNTVFPRYAERLWVLPSRRVTVKSRIGVFSFRTGIPAFSRAFRSSAGIVLAAVWALQTGRIVNRTRIAKPGARYFMNTVYYK
jgi:hypothetical protein